MADVDNLESLSNAELHAQMVAQGLPNIPVTDSSRKVLVKRLRVSLGGNAASPSTASPKKTGNRRETMQPAAAIAAQVDKLDGSTKTRRSIAFPPSDTKEADRRRKPETVAIPQREPEVVKPIANATAAAAASKAVPIQARRTSTQRLEQLNERVAKKPDVITEETTATKQRPGEKSLAVNTLIILESDEEEEEQMTRALNRAEEQLLVKQKTTKPKLTTTTTSTYQYTGESAYPEKKQQQPQLSQQKQQFVSSPLYPVLEPNLQRNQQQARQPLERSSLAYEQQAPISYSQPARTTMASSYATSGRYSNYLSQVQGYAVSTGATATASSAAASSVLSHRRSPPRTFTREFSDDNGDDTEEPRADGSKFESEFARNLARLRSERIGERSYNIRSNAPSSITSGRRSIRPEDNSTYVAFNRWWHSLDREYNVKSKLFILLVALLLYIVYRIYY